MPISAKNITCLSKLFAEISLSSSKSKMYLGVTLFIEEIIQEYINYCKKCHWNITELYRTLLVIYWLPKMHKIPTSARFTVASKNYSTKTLTDTISTVLKMVFNTVESLHNRSLFYSICKTFQLSLSKIKSMSKKLNLLQILT